MQQINPSQLVQWASAQAQRPVLLDVREGWELQTASASAPSAAAKVASIDGQPTLTVQDTMDRAWRRVGLALDRSGFTVEDRDRSKGIYFVRYVPAAKAEESGFFSRIFSSKSPTQSLTRYQVQLKDQGSATLVRVLSQSGQTETSDNAEKILKLLAAELR